MNQKSLKRFKLVSPFQPTGDQPQAIEKLTKNLKVGAKNQLLWGLRAVVKLLL